MIPANNAAAEEKEERKEEEIGEDEKQQHFHVLVVDDDPTQRKISECLLQKSSHRVTCVDSGHKALEYLGILDNLYHNPSFHSPQHQEIKVNLIMTDYYMPGMTGYDLLKCLKRSAWKDVPVVVVSSENISSRISMCLKEGAEAFLLKPLKALDIQNLQPLLLKSLDHNHLYRTETNDGSNLLVNNNNSSISQRKALSPESTADQRLKLEELAVV